MIHLADNWKDILQKAWSVRFIILAGILTGIEAILPFISSEIPGFKLITLSVVAGALIARLLAQKDIK
jgi:hypothetical protein